MEGVTAIVHNVGMRFWRCISKKKEWEVIYECFVIYVKEVRELSNNRQYVNPTNTVANRLEGADKKSHTAENRIMKK